MLIKMRDKEIQDTECKDENENPQNKNTEQENPMNKRNARINHDKIRKGPNDSVNIFLLICIIGVTLGILLEFVNWQNRYRNGSGKLKYWVYSRYNDVDNKNGILKHVHLVLERIGYENSGNDTPWDLLWSHDYPFRALYPSLNRLKPNQRVNHIPGIGFLTNKVNLATTDSKYIPKAFELPKNKDAFLKYASENKNALFLEKHNQHRGVYLRNVSQIDLVSGEKFVQEFIPNPFLVDGHKFDIGVYVVVTSVNPLRIYWYKGDVLFRYCPLKYHPLDPQNLDKYVIGDDYLPTWNVPSLAHPYSALGASMKDAFDVYATSKGKNTTKMWEDVQNAIVDVFLKKAHHLVEGVKNYASQDNFFEMMRVDLIVDEDFRVYLLEANMSPNLSSAHYPPNQLLYEQVLYSLFSITGVSNDVVERYKKSGTSEVLREVKTCTITDPSTQEMLASQKNIAVWGTECSTVCKDRCEEPKLCNLCKPCIDKKLRNSLLRAHKEFMHRGDFRRLFPPAMKQGSQPNEADLKSLTELNNLQYWWYQGKCNQDITWCH